MIYCVEDDNSIRDLMIYTLKASGFEAEGFSESQAFYEAVDRKKPQLVILDIMLPGEDGLTILKKLRNSVTTADIPVIMATAKGTEYDKVIGLDGGADDYLAKPFGMMEMVSRIKAVLRRSTKPENRTLVLGELELNPNEYSARVGGKSVQLTLKEYELLRLFMENPGKVYTRDVLLTKIWNVDYAGETRTVDVHIGTLRNKLLECGEYIETVRGVGYRIAVRIK